MNLKDRRNIILDRTIELLDKASEQYELHFDMEDVVIDFGLKGISAGMAKWQMRQAHTGEILSMTNPIIRYNDHAILTDFDHMLNDTVPHEVAHLVVPVEYSRTGRSRAWHGPIWQRVCKELGGTGETYHQMKLPKARIVREWLYRLPSGKELKIKTNRHNKIQNGKQYTVGSTGEPIRPEHFIKQV